MSRRSRTRCGSMLAESAAAFALLLPLLIIVVYVTLEASQALVIARSMNQGAFLASRALAVNYQTNPEVVTNTSEKQAIFSTIRTPNMITGNSQFTIPSNSWDLTSYPPTVTVVVTYLSGQGDPELPPFPNPDILNLGTSFRSSVHPSHISTAVIQQPWRRASGSVVRD